MKIEGGLAIDLHCDGHSVAHAEIASTRPLGAARLLLGKTPEEAAALAPMIFSVCANAQGSCAASALERATDRAPCPASEAARRCLILAETAQEHLLTIALRWPPFLDEPPTPEIARRAMRAAGAVKTALYGDQPPFVIGARPAPELDAYAEAIEGLEALIEEAALGAPAPSFLSGALIEWAKAGASPPARLAAALLRRGWAEAAPTDGVEHLTDADETALSERLGAADADSFIARPEWNGAARETTALTRRWGEPLVAAARDAFGVGLLTRLAARLVDLARIPGELREAAAAFSAPRGAPAVGAPRGVGLAQADAARGRLVHRARVEAGRIADYRILAPTEWNFHPSGPAARGLERLSGDAHAIEAQARLLIEAVDPCVGFTVRIC